MTISRRGAFRQLLLMGVASAVWMRSESAVADTIAYQYDALGRVIKVTYPNGVVVDYVYDDAGNRTRRTSQLPNAPNGTFAANPTSIASGQSSTLSWTSTNSTSASINQGIGSVTPVAGGSRVVSPTATTTYTLTLTGPSGSTTRQATVTVAPPSGFTATIAVSGAAPIDLRALANGAGYNGAQNATVIFEVNNGVTISGVGGSATSGSGNPGGIAIDTGTWPTGSYAINLTLLVKTGGKVFGGGGAGGLGVGAGGGGAGGVGGDAIYCRLPINVTVQSGGEIKAAGGGGGGGLLFVTGGPGGTMQYGGGGGGGGFPNGAGGGGGIGSGGGGNGGAGAGGTPSSGGAGGVGASSAGAGGVGGNAGAAGAQGNTSPTGGSAPFGGAAGYAIRKNGHTVTVTNNGTIVGTVG